MQSNREQRRAAARAATRAARTLPAGPALNLGVRYDPGVVVLTATRSIEHGGPVALDLPPDTADQLAELLHTAARGARTRAKGPAPTA